MEAGNTVWRGTNEEFLAHNTVRIEADLTDGGISVGTGFLYQFFSSDGTPVPAIVTNKHVLENVQRIRLVFNPRGQDSNVDLKADKFGFDISEFQNGWRKHPNPDIDLAFIAMNVPLARMSENGFLPQATFLTRENLPRTEEWNRLTALEDLVIVGYPYSIWDSVNNFPVFKKGIAATHPKIDYEGRSEFLVDAAIYPGSSGSPVFLYRREKVMRGEELNLGLDKPRLVGIIYAVFLHQQEGEMKRMPIPTVKNKVPVMSIPNNLGLAIKSTELDGFIPVIDKKLEEECQQPQLPRNNQAV
jgi:V8-like Glu-specific endopeptidase